MRRRDFLLSLAASSAAAPAQARRPDIVILLADDLGWHDVGFHGSEIRTPHLDALAMESLELTRFYSCPLCSPTRSALMTGRYPLRLGTGFTVIRPWFDFGIPLEEHFLPQTFQTAGYETAMAGKWHLGHSRRAYLPGARGFQRSYGHFNGAIDYYSHERDGGLDWHRDGQALREEGYSTDLIGAEAVRRIRERDRAKPLLLYVPFNAPHGPLQPPPGGLDAYASIEDRQRRTFAAMTQSLDANIGRILAALATEGMAENTIVLFFSDNGGPTSAGARNTPLRGAKGSTWEGGMRVPALIRWPGRIRPGRSRQLISAMDMFPTLASAAGLRPANQRPLDGLDLWPAISAGKTAARRDPLFFSIESARATHFAVFDGPWKLVREIQGQEDRRHLFRIEDDPNEAADVAAKHPKIAASLVAKLDEWRRHALPQGLHHEGAAPRGHAAPRAWADAVK